MAKKIFGVYLAKLDAPNSEAHARLELPASPWELHDAVDKVQLQENEELYLEIDDYYSFEYLAPHLMELDASLNELNDLAGRLAVLDETEQEAFDGLLRLEIQRKVESNAGIITMQDMRDLAASAGADCCHVVDATSDTELGRFYAENGFMEELDGLSDDVFEMLDFGKIGKALRTGENGTFTRNGYVVQHSELITAPLCAKELPPKPEYLFRLTLGLHPDLEDDRTVTLELPTSAMISEMANRPISSTTRAKPLLSWYRPKVKRGLESIGARPTVASSAPSTALIRPLGMSWPVRAMTIDREKIASAQYSYAWNFSAKLHSTGDSTISRIRPMIVPMKENTTPVPSAFPASPLSAIGFPSKQVATEEGVPGIFSRMAEIRPPEIPPMYSAISMEMPCEEVTEYVTGRNMTTAIVAVRPGIEPKMIPTMVPSATRAMVSGWSTAVKPSKTIVSPYLSYRPKMLRMPTGSSTLSRYRKI